MRNIYLLLIILFQMISCTGSPQLVPIKRPLTFDTDKRCMTPFPDRELKLVHSIQATMPKGEKAVMLGVTAISPKTGMIQCVIMTLEGLVLFDARYDRQIVINRAIPPFDSIDFARGLINDIKLIFFPPDGLLIASGISDDGSFVCRYRTDSGMIVDIITHKDRPWEIRQYDHDFRLIRSLKTHMGSERTTERQNAIPARLELTAYGPSEYSLTLELIEARELTK
ncbi:MAG: hypothetical protein KJ573_00410 [Proteobacteria bacterium]|jgi:hypothetical protein|nr:hypothetical protein [Pseudomonadota bacterium]MBU1902036.1 hypothetical protein [Pseudomonadota bacterium]